MRKILIAVIVTLLFSKAENYTVLTFEDIVDTPWKYRNDEVFLGWIVFSHNQSILTYTSQYEKYWGIVNNQLEIYSANKTLTVKFTSTFNDYSKKWRLQGMYLPKNRPSNSYRYLEQMI